MKREQALEVMKVAGYHDDKRTWVRVYAENRVSFKAAQEAFAKGKQARAAGVGCGCSDCKSGNN